MSMTPSSTEAEGRERAGVVLWSAWIDAANVTREILLSTFGQMQDELADEPAIVETLQGLIEALEAKASFATDVALALAQRATLPSDRTPVGEGVSVTEEMVERGARGLAREVVANGPYTQERIDTWVANNWQRYVPNARACLTAALKSPPLRGSEP